MLVTRSMAGSAGETEERVRTLLLEHEQRMTKAMANKHHETIVYVDHVVNELRSHVSKAINALLRPAANDVEISTDSVSVHHTPTALSAPSGVQFAVGDDASGNNTSTFGTDEHTSSVTVDEWALRHASLVAPKQVSGVYEQEDVDTALTQLAADLQRRHAAKFDKVRS